MRYGITKLGTQVKLPDGRAATVVYNSLCGVGIKLGLHDPPPEAFDGTDGNTVKDGQEGFEWQPDAMLREPEMSERLGMPCICEDSEVEILRIGLTENAPALPEPSGDRQERVVGGKEV